jgi:hypothetical protein
MKSGGSPVMENAAIGHTTNAVGIKMRGDNELTKKRITVWFLETQCEVLLLSVLCTYLSFFNGHGPDGFFRELVISFLVLSTLFLATGYLLTTAIIAAFWRGHRLWLYPVFAAVLYSIILQILLFLLSDLNSSEKQEILTVRLAGPCIVFLCTFVGGYFLRGWAPAGNKLAQAPNGKADHTLSADGP